MPNVLFLSLCLYHFREEHDVEIENPDVAGASSNVQKRRKPPVYADAEPVEESPIKPAAHKPEESAPDVGDLLKALNGDNDDIDNDTSEQTTPGNDGDVNDNLQKPDPDPVNRNGDSNGPESGDAVSVDNHDGVIKKPATTAAKPLQNGVNPTKDNGNNEHAPKKVVKEDPVNSNNKKVRNNSDGQHQDTDEEMEGRMYITFEPEMPFHKSKVPTVESAPNISALLGSLKDKPDQRPAAGRSSTPDPPKSPRKVTDNQVADALRFLLGTGVRVPRAHSAMDLRSDSAKKLRGGGRRKKKPAESSRTFILAMMPDGTPKRIPIERRPSLGNELDSDADSVESFDVPRKSKLPRNEFDGRQERPPSPADISRETSPSPPAANVVNAATLNNDRPQSSNEPKLPPYSSDDVFPTSPNDDQSDLANLLERLRPEGGGKPEHDDDVTVTIADLVEVMPSFDITDSSDDDDNEDIKTNQRPVIEVEIEAAAPVVPEESAIDFAFLDKKQPESITEPRAPSSSDASSRSTDTRPTSSSDASSRSTEWQEATIDMSEDEIVPDVKSPTETSPDLVSSLEKLRPVGMEASIPENDDAMKLPDEPPADTYPTERGTVTVADLEHLVPSFEDTPSAPVEEDTIPDEETTAVEEEIPSVITVFLNDKPVDLSVLSDLDPEESDDSRPYDVSDIIDDLPVDEDDDDDDAAWPEPPHESSDEESEWPAPPPDNLLYSGIKVDVQDSDDDLPPVPIPQEISAQDVEPQSPGGKSPDNASPKTSPDLPPRPDSLPISDTPRSPRIASPDDRVPRFVAVDTPKRPKSRGSPSRKPPKIVIDVAPSSEESEDDQESSVEPHYGKDDSSSDDGTSVDASPKEEDVVTSVMYNPSVTSPDLNILEKLRPDGEGDDVPVAAVYVSPESPSDEPSVNVNKEHVRVSDLEDLIPTFDDTTKVQSDENDEEFEFPPPPAEEDLCIAVVAPPPEESSIDLSQLDRSPRMDDSPTVIEAHLDIEPAPRKWSELSTESQEVTLDFAGDSEFSEDDDKVVPMRQTPVESALDLLALERKFRPSGMSTPEPMSDSDSEFQPDNRPTERTGATVADLKDLVPTFDSSSQSSDTASISSEPPSPVDEMIEEIGSVSPTRKVFDFEGLEQFAPKEEPTLSENDPPLVDYAQQKSQDIIVESYMSIFREERVLELLKTFSSKDDIPADNEVSTSPVVDIKETASSSSTEDQSSSVDENEILPRNSDLLEAERPTPDSPSKKRRSMGLEVDDGQDDDEIPTKKTKTFDDALSEEREEEDAFDDEPIIIEAGISVFREETIIEASPPSSPEKHPVDTGDMNDDEDEWPAPPPHEFPSPPPPEFPSPPPPELLANDEWPSPPKGMADAPEHRDLKIEQDHEEEEDTEDTSSVSSSSTEGEYVTEPSPSGADRVFVLTVVPALDSFKEEDEEEDVESGGDRDDERVVPTENIPDHSRQSSASDTSSSTEKENDHSDQDDHPLLHRGPQFYDDDSSVTKPLDNEEEKVEYHEAPSAEKFEPQISISSAEPVDSAPRDIYEGQPGIYDPEDDQRHSEEPSEQTSDTVPSKSDESEKDLTSVSDASSMTAEDASVGHPERTQHDDGMPDSEPSDRAKVNDTPMDQALDSSNEDDDEDENITRRPPHDPDSVSSYSSSESDGEEPPYTPTAGGRVFILSGFSAHPDNDNDLNDNESGEKTHPENDNEDYDLSDLKQQRGKGTLSELIPVTTSPTTEKTPEFANEKPIEITPVDNLESAPVNGHGPSDPEDNATSPTDNVMTEVYSPDQLSYPADITPQTASDTFASPPSGDDYTHPEPDRPAKFPEHESPARIPDFIPLEEQSATWEVSDDPSSADGPNDAVNDQEIPEDIPKIIPLEEQSDTWEEEDVPTNIPAFIPLEEQRNEFEEPGDISEDRSDTWDPPVEPSVADSTYNAPPREEYGMGLPSSSPRHHDFSSSATDNLPSSPRSVASTSSPLPSTQGPSFSHYIPTSGGGSSKPMHSLILDQRHYETDDATGSDAEIAQFTSRVPSETEFRGPSPTTVPNLAPYMPTSKPTADDGLQSPVRFDAGMAQPIPGVAKPKGKKKVPPPAPPRIESDPLLQREPVFYDEPPSNGHLLNQSRSHQNMPPDSPVADYMDPTHSKVIDDPASSRFDSDMRSPNDYLPQQFTPADLTYDPNNTFDQRSSLSTDIDDPASPSGFESSASLPYIPPSRATDRTDPGYEDPVPPMSQSTDINDPASSSAFATRVLPSRSTDIDDPAEPIPLVQDSIPHVPNSKSTDIDDPAVPEDLRYPSPRQRSPFEPILMEASPMTFGKARPKTPVEYETSLVPPDVYAGDDAYEQFQTQYRGLPDDYDTIPDMRQQLQQAAPKTRNISKRPEEKTRKQVQDVSDMPSYLAPPVPVHAGVAKPKGKKKLPPPPPPRIESDPLLQREPVFYDEPPSNGHLRNQSRSHQNLGQPQVMMSLPRFDSENDEPPMPFQPRSISTDINDPGMPYNQSSSRPKSMDISDLAMSPRRSSSQSTDLNEPYPSRAQSMGYLAESAPTSFNSRPNHAQSMVMPVPSYQTRIQDPSIPYPSRSADPITDPRLYHPAARSKTTDINDPGFEPPFPGPMTVAPQYLVPSRGPIPDVTKPPPKAMTKDVELEYLKTQLHRLGTKMAATRNELDRFKQNNPAHKYARPQDRTAQSRGSSRSSMDSPDDFPSDLQFSRKFFASLTDKEFGKMLEEMRRYRLAVRDKGADLKRISKQCDGIRLRLKQLGHRELQMDVPAGNVRVGAIETTI